MEELKVMGVGKFVGFNIPASKVATLKLKMRYDEIEASANLIMAYNVDVMIHAKVDGKVLRLGLFKLSNINFDKDRNATLILKALIEQIEEDNVISMIRAEMDEMPFLFRTKLELEGNAE